MIKTPCPKCKKFTKILNKNRKEGYTLNYCKKCKLIFAYHHYFGMDMDGEMHPYKSNIMVNSPVWKDLVKDIKLPEGECIDYRYKGD